MGRWYVVTLDAWRSRVWGLQLRRFSEHDGLANCILGYLQPFVA